MLGWSSFLIFPFGSGTGNGGFSHKRPHFFVLVQKHRELEVMSASHNRARAAKKQILNTLLPAIQLDIRR
jgi:hypothetical protein